MYGWPYFFLETAQQMKSFAVEKSLHSHKYNC